MIDMARLKPAKPFLFMKMKYCLSYLEINLSNMGSIQFTYTTGLIPKNIRKHDRNPLCVNRVSTIHQYIIVAKSWLIRDIDNCTFRSTFTMTGQLLLGVTFIYEKEHLQNGYVQTRLIFLDYTTMMCFPQRRGMYHCKCSPMMVSSPEC